MGGGVRRDQCLALIYHGLGRSASPTSTSTRLIATAGSREPALVAEVYAFRGETEEAFQWLQTSRAQLCIEPHDVCLAVPEVAARGCEVGTGDGAKVLIALSPLAHRKILSRTSMNLKRAGSRKLASSARTASCSGVPSPACKAAKLVSHASSMPSKSGSAPAS